MEKVAIVGVGQTAFSAERRGETYADLVYEAVSAALADAGLSIADVGNIVTASNDFWDGRTISSMAVGDAAGAAYGEGKNISTVEGDGTSGAFYGLSRILSGAYETTLVVAHAKSSEGDPRLITNAFLDPVCERSLGLDAVAAAALQARLVMERLRAEHFAEVVVRARERGARNPKAHLRQALTIEEALASPLIAPPLRAADVAPDSDGACAVILAREGFARERCRKPVWVRGVGLCAEAGLGARDLAQSRALREAAARAYRMAGIASPEREIDVAEVSADFSYQEPLWLSELALPRPEAVNLSGGTLCARAPIVAGLVRLIEAALQVRGEASSQAPSVRTALAHGQYGLCGQSHGVWILGN